MLILLYYANPNKVTIKKYYLRGKIYKEFVVTNDRKQFVYNVNKTEIAIF